MEDEGGEAVHVGCLGVSHTSYSPNPKQIGFRHRRKPSVWPSPRRLLRRNPINRQHMAIGYGMDYGLATANLKLRYYESCTWCVGGRFRTSTPSINPPMGPTSWLNRPVPLPDNLSSDEAKLRSCNYTQTFLLSVAPLAKNLF
ncbi:unnamed protein product [Scomber scombrus]|uniref:Unnamed protein product n=1 Tax=Scomber scombrus TaxID=13677 RepID=A0AAV1MRV1_SCOSC